jgi:hypothetical protein
MDSIVKRKRNCKDPIAQPLLSSNMVITKTGRKCLLALSLNLKIKSYQIYKFQKKYENKSGHSK